MNAQAGTQSATTPAGTAATDDLVALMHRVVACVAPEPVGAVTSVDNLVTDLHYTSLSRVELMFTLEDLFALEGLSADVAASLATVGDLERYVTVEVAEGRGRRPDDETVDELLGPG